MPFTNLRAFLQQRGGAVPFQQFMEAALFDPQFGYYSSRVREIGPRGDFATSATLGSALGRAVANWARAEAERFPELRGAGGKFHLVEIGPGTGALAAQVLRALPFWQRHRWKLHLVDRSPGLMKAQRKSLAGFRHVAWHDSPAAALKAAGGRAILFSNELVDAFPVYLLEWDGASWLEIWLELNEAGRLVETLRPPSRALSGSALEYFSQHPPAQGQRVELHLSYRDWLDEWSTQCLCGSLLTIDYGSTMPGLYVRRRQGTLRSYLLHQRREGAAVYENMGRQDITADVNFDDVRAWGEARGFATDFLTTQAEFLQRYSKLTAGPDLRLGSLGDAGEAFLVLAQRKHP